MVLIPTAESKLLARWQGPYEVIEAIGEVDYKVRQPGCWKLEQIYHINLLKPWQDREAPVVALGAPSPTSNQPDLVRISSELILEQRSEVISLIERNQDVFSEKPVPKEDWLMSQVYRRDILNSTCLMNNLSHSQSKLKHNVARQIFVEHNHKFIYCEVPKVGCSNWKKIIILLTMNLSRKANEVQQNLIHRTPLIKRLSSYPSDYQEELLTSYTKVMFTRDPLERLVSAYRDKLLHSEPYYSITVANEIKATCRKNKNSAEKVTFQEFVNFILTKNQEHLDIHWKPMFLLCDPCNIHYDILGKFETLEQDSEHVLRNIGAPEDLHYPNFKTHSSEKRTNDDITLEYFRKLSSEQIEKIKKLYQMDFALFNYPYDLKMNLYKTDTV
ncbi:carbohydrate sulfotransferase 9-like [Pangshura tecta]